MKLRTQPIFQKETATEKTPSIGLTKTEQKTTADIALLYTSNCGRITNIRFKEMAADIHAILVKYITEYGIFLNREIDRLFKHITTIHSQEDHSEYSQDLEIRLEQLTLLNEYKHVFEYIDGNRKVEFWRRKFHEQYRTILGQIENLKVSGRYNKLHEKLNTVQGLIGVDHFCGGKFLTEGFGALYRDYQIETTKKSKETYHVVLENILQEDYAATESAMIDIDKKTANPSDIAQIEQKLQVSLHNLMKNTQKLANSLDLNNDFKAVTESQIQLINANTDKICTVLMKPKIMAMINEKIKLNLTEFEQKITTCLSTVLLQAISTIENFMETNDVLEAELNTERLLLVRREIDNHFNLESVTEKMNEIKKRLDSLGDHLLVKIDLKNIQQYPTHSPKDLVVKLQKAAEYHSAKYKKVETYISAEIRRNFQTAIDATCAAPIEKRSELIDPLHYSLDFLPDDLQTLFRTQINKLKDKFLEESLAYKRELEGFLKSDIVNDTTIEKVNGFAIQYDREKRDELLTILHSGVLAKLASYWKIIQAAFEKDEISSATENMRHVIKYRIYAPAIPSTEQFYKLVRDLISKSVRTYSDTLSNIFTIQKIEAVDQAFTNLTLCIEFSQSYPEKINDLISQKVFQIIIIKLETMHRNWEDTVNDFNLALIELNISALRSLLEITDRCDRVLQNIRNTSCAHPSIKAFVQKMKKVLGHSELISNFKKKINELAQIFTEKLIRDKTMRFETERDQFFSNLSTSLKTFKLINTEFPKMFLSVDFEQIERDLKIKIEEIKRKLLTYATQTDISESEADEFRTYYNHLLSFEKYISYPDVNIPQSLELAEKHILDKVAMLAKNIASAGADFTKVAEFFIRMKFFAENLSMFEAKINRTIDECLKSFKASQGPTMIGQLTMILEKNELGARLMSEHSGLTGEDWRKRREKMQKQDDLEYVLKELTGDDLKTEDELATDIVRKRYTVFRSKYDDLISKNLAAFNLKTETEPKLDVLISETKALIAEGVQKYGEIKWDRSLRDKIPDLLAHIFAVWTLKNTQHYNSMRGIDSARAYLLMPHVAQVISIFRIFGLGYTKDTKLLGISLHRRSVSNDLINNLVEVGTGEGKSIIMAVVACVFALNGIDVDCSCYSEYLSMRDKNDFAPVFQALGIDERIEYGTFNRL
ncbi:unnamed protein product [Didymodactylos carnosus]|uniref:SecA DEAD-like N-terminal domain-containing protein n=1 Tax=Didymodactylos carnosus TaxID=1234261 RepID=A0A815N1X0_9BILA|nr:unnamed protein product [Didymodactylos carnosus]CAF4306635.1 unnamed protein product [Didymodactylos carnosus]